MTGELVRFDIFVVARLCDYLNCTITDIIEYVKIEKWIEFWNKKSKFNFFYFNKI